MPGAGASARDFEVVIVGGTPGGIMTAVAAARQGHTSVLLERTRHVGGLPANGLGATDIHTRGATGGLFLEFVGRIKRYYTDRYGPNSQQVKDCSDGYHFEPSVAEQVFEELLAEQPNVTVVRMRQFDALPERVEIRDGTIRSIRVQNRETGELETYTGRIFIDATYEGDLAAAAGVPYRLGREGKTEFDEPMAGRLYKYWGGPVEEGSTFLGDNAVQAYNYRLCLTTDPQNMVPVPKPEHYDRTEYLSLVGDVWSGRHTGVAMTTITPAQRAENRQLRAEGKPAQVPGEPKGMQRIVNKVSIPNGKTDANNEHLAFISTDLPEENWPWPTSGWDWRDRFARRLREYTLGLLWFAQHDTSLPAGFREQTSRWGLAADEYQDNDHFPRQVYVREGRRMVGEHLFTAHDALPVKEGGRPPIYRTSVTASHYALDSHAVRKREPGRVHLDGFFSMHTEPYTVPYGVMVPVKIKNLLTPVPVSGTHVGFSTLRMEPCWMALGQAAGTAASVSIEQDVQIPDINLRVVQSRLLRNGAVLMYFNDAGPGDDHYEVLQYFALRGFLGDVWQARLNQPVSDATARTWADRAGANLPQGYSPGQTTRGAYLDLLYRQINLNQAE